MGCAQRFAQTLHPWPTAAQQTTAKLRNMSEAGGAQLRWKNFRRQQLRELARADRSSFVTSRGPLFE